MSHLRALWRIARALAHVLRGLWIIRSEFAQLTPDACALLVREWSRQMLDIMGIKLSLQGEAPRGGPLLLLPNHVSWLDILVINAAYPVRFVSKAAVKHWPVLGALITGAGTILIERESRRDAMRVVHHMVEHLKAGEVVAVFPEGTTNDGATLLPFHGNLLQAAITADSPAMPVGLKYVDGDTGQRSDAPQFFGNTTLLASVWRTLRVTGLRAEVRYGEPERWGGRSRREWAQDMHAAVARLLG